MQQRQSNKIHDDDDLSYAGVCCRSFFQQLMVAVDYCHAMGIPLTDIRPENMTLVEPNDAPSLSSISKQT
jgi:serine/threonine protein kinase